MEIFYEKQNGSHNFYRRSMAGSGEFDRITVAKTDYRLEVVLSRVDGFHSYGPLIYGEIANGNFTRVYGRKQSKEPKGERFSLAETSPLEHLSPETILCIISRGRMEINPDT